MGKEIMKKMFVAIAGGAVVVGCIFVYETGKNSCGIELNDVNSNNLISKMAEKIETLPLDKDEYLYGCDLKEFKGGVEYSDKNCKTKSKKDFEKFKEENIEKAKRLKDFKYKEANQISNDFLDIWNYHVMEKCGLVEK